MKRSAYYVVFYTHVDDKKCSRGVCSVYEANFLGYIDSRIAHTHTVRFHFISFIVPFLYTLMCSQLCSAQLSFARLYPQLRFDFIVFYCLLCN